MLMDIFTSPEFWIFCGVGFLAQLIDGALGMAYGVVCIAVLSSLGVPPAAASAVVHAAEVFTTATAATSHAAHKNIDLRLFLRLAPAGVLGGVIGAYILTAAPQAYHRPPARRLPGPGRGLPLLACISANRGSQSADEMGRTARRSGWIP